ncbi:hypothetical protein CSPX01_15086, partial [Colletotrichum filicis]
AWIHSPLPRLHLYYTHHNLNPRGTKGSKRKSDPQKPYFQTRLSIPCRRLLPRIRGGRILPVPRPVLSPHPLIPTPPSKRRLQDKEQPPAFSLPKKFPPIPLSYPETSCYVDMWMPALALSQPPLGNPGRNIGFSLLRDGGGPGQDRSKSLRGNWLFPGVGNLPRKERKLQLLMASDYRRDSTGECTTGRV